MLKEKYFFPSDESILIKKMPAVIVKDSEIQFVDRINNNINPGTMIFYAAQNTLKVGVFVGILEKNSYGEHYLYSSETAYTNLNKNGLNHTALNRYGLCKYVYRSHYITYACLGSNSKCKYKYIEIDLEKARKKKVFKLNRFLAIENPEFKVHDLSIGQLFSLIDSLKNGYLKDYKGEDE